VNQLIAHHSIIFKPEERIVWVSSSPWQCGKYYAYDLKKIFSRKGVPVRDEEITDKSREIGADPFVKSEEMISYEKYRTIRAGLKKAIKDKTTVDDAGLKTFIASNPEMYLAYQTAGDYLFSRGEFVKARDYYTAALTKEVARKSEREKIEESIRACDKSAE